MFFATYRHASICDTIVYAPFHLEGTAYAELREPPAGHDSSYSDIPSCRSLRFVILFTIKHSRQRPDYACISLTTAADTLILHLRTMANMSCMPDNSLQRARSRVAAHHCAFSIGSLTRQGGRLTRLVILVHTCMCVKVALKCTDMHNLLQTQARGNHSLKKLRSEDHAVR
jgi:hypothetical protein